MYCATSSLGKVVTITNLIALGGSVQLWVTNDVKGKCF